MVFLARIEVAPQFSGRADHFRVSVKETHEKKRAEFFSVDDAELRANKRGFVF